MPSRRTGVATPPALAATFVDLTLRRLPRLLPGGRILDAGCGDGLLLGLLRERLPEGGPWELWGVEEDPERARAAARRLGPAGIRILQGDLLESAWRDPTAGRREVAVAPGSFAGVLGNPPSCLSG